MNIAAIIPARKNSKRIPKKNRAKINNELFIQKVIDNIRASEKVDSIYVSTDDEYLEAKIARAKILDRGNLFTDDFSTVIDLLSHHHENELSKFDIILLAYFHSICISPKIYSRAIEEFIGSPKNRMISVAPLPTPIKWLYEEDKNKQISPIDLGAEKIRSQDLPSAFYNTGQFYLYKKPWFANQDLSDNIYFKLKGYQGVDVDEPHDLEVLRSIYHANKLVDKSLL